MRKIIIGQNDLYSSFSEIAKEADGWDTKSVSYGSAKKMLWRCREGHKWEATIKSRTCLGRGCPYCSNQKVLRGFNDLKTKFPNIAKEADGWDPKTLLSGTDKKMPWKCIEGHTWEAAVSNRTTSKTGCPYCSNKKVLRGFNDLKTKFPEIAKEADGWDPSFILFGAHKKFSWKCSKGHQWKTSPSHRILDKSSCPACAETGFSPDKPAWFYLLKRDGEQQFGISNSIERRLKDHSLKGWKEIEKTGPHDGYEVLKTEKKLKVWLKSNIGLIKGTTENWYVSKIEVHSLAELKEKSGIETTLF